MLQRPEPALSERSLRQGPYLHDGRAKTLLETLKGDHSPEKVTGLDELTDDELKDLVEYVKSL